MLLNGGFGFFLSLNSFITGNIVKISNETPKLIWAPGRSKQISQEYNLFIAEIAIKNIYLV